MFFQRGDLKRALFITSFSLLGFLFLFSIYASFAQESTKKGSVELINMNNTGDPDYEGYQELDEDNDAYITEDDLYLRLELINEQVTNASTNLTYLQTTYGMKFTLTPITTNAVIKNSANSAEYQSLLPQTRSELEHLAEEINGIQNQIGDLDLTDPEIVSIKQYFDMIDENLYYALWYTGRG